MKLRNNSRNGRIGFMEIFHFWDSTALQSCSLIIPEIKCDCLALSSFVDVQKEV